MQLPQAHLVVLAACTLSVSLVSGHASRRGEPNRDPFGGGGLNATAINNATNTPDPIVPPISFSSGFVNASASAVSSSINSVATSTLPSASASESDPTATVISASSDSTSTNNGTVTAIAASVGASIAVSLIVVGGVLFCLRTRSSSHPIKSNRSTSTLETETTALAWRLTSLETEASTLRERVARLEARGRRSREGAGVVYANEKDDGMGAGRVKDCPPTYVD